MATTTHDVIIETVKIAEPAEPPVTEAIPFITPINLILFSLALYLIYTRLRPAPPPVITTPQPLVYQSYTPTTLSKFNGLEETRILIGVKRKVFDMTPGKGFYGPGGPYSVFAGRDASRGLAKNQLDESLLTPLGEKLDKLEDLTGEEKESLDGWFEQFEGKYLIVGDLVDEGEGDEE